MQLEVTKIYTYQRIYIFYPCLLRGGGGGGGGGGGVVFVVSPTFIDVKF